MQDFSLILGSICFTGKITSECRVSEWVSDWNGFYSEQCQIVIHWRPQNVNVILRTITYTCDDFDYKFLYIPASGRTSLQGKDKGVMECWYTSDAKLPVMYNIKVCNIILNIPHFVFKHKFVFKDVFFWSEKKFPAFNFFLLLVFAILG